MAKLTEAQHIRNLSSVLEAIGNDNTPGQSVGTLKFANSDGTRILQNAEHHGKDVNGWDVYSGKSQNGWWTIYIVTPDTNKVVASYRCEANQNTQEFVRTKANFTIKNSGGHYWDSQDVMKRYFLHNNDDTHLVA